MQRESSKRQREEFNGPAEAMRMVRRMEEIKAKWDLWEERKRLAQEAGESLAALEQSEQYQELLQERASFQKEFQDFLAKAKPEYMARQRSH